MHGARAGATHGQGAGAGTAHGLGAGPGAARGHGADAGAARAAAHDLGAGPGAARGSLGAVRDAGAARAAAPQQREQYVEQEQLDFVIDQLRTSGGRQENEMREQQAQQNQQM
eukprot:1606607-Heterocapsa_arctica.AAC.1